MMIPVAEDAEPAMRSQEKEICTSGILIVLAREAWKSAVKFVISNLEMGYI